MSSFRLGSPIYFPNLDDRPLPNVEPNNGNEDDEETIIDREVRGHREPELRATESVDCYVRLSQLEIHSGGAEESCRSDEAVPFPRSERSTDPVFESPPVQQSRRNRRTPRVARLGPRSGTQRRAKAKFPKQVAHRPSTRSPTQRKSGPNLHRDSVDVMKAWVKDHMDYPYPSAKEKEELAHRTGLKKSQVTDWFIRERKRHLKPPADLSNSSNGLFRWVAESNSETSNQDLTVPDVSTNCNELLGVDIAESPLLSQQDPCLSRRSTTPLERYLSAPAQEEGSPFQTCNSLQNDRNQPQFIFRQDHNLVSSPEILRATQASNVTNYGDSLHLSNQQSTPSIQSTDASGRSTRQRGRRLFTPPKVAPEREGDLRYQCTRCNQGYRYPSDCVRHEETHTPQQDCVCMLDGARLKIQGREVCAFCGDSNPTDDHLTSVHNVLECHMKPKQDRTYTRPSGLLRHMTDTHHATVPQAPNSWIVRVPNPSPYHWCGYCGRYHLMTWEERGIHMRNHNLTDDYDMTQWIPLDDIGTGATAPTPSFDFSLDI